MSTGHSWTPSIIFTGIASSLQPRRSSGSSLCSWSRRKVRRLPPALPGQTPTDVVHDDNPALMLRAPLAHPVRGAIPGEDHDVTFMCSRVESVRGPVQTTTISISACKHSTHKQMDTCSLRRHDPRLIETTCKGNTAVDIRRNNGVGAYARPKPDSTAWPIPFSDSGRR